MAARTVGTRRERLPAVERMGRRVEDGIDPVDPLVADPTTEIHRVPAAPARRMAERFETPCNGGQAGEGKRLMYRVAGKT